MRKRCFIVSVVAVFFLLATFGWAAQYNIKIAHNLPPTKDSLYHQTALKFKELVEKSAPGKVAVHIYPSAQLGSDVSVAKKVQSGAIEMEIITANKLGSFYPGIDLYSLPFLLKDFDVAARVFKSDVHKEIEQELEKKTGLKSLAFVAAGFRNITNSKHPINKPGDIKEHLRYPEDLFTIQIEMYGTYQMTDPQVFYTKEDVWQRPREKYHQEDDTVVEPYHIMASLPGGGGPQFLLMSPYTPREKNVLRSWI